MMAGGETEVKTEVKTEVECRGGAVLAVVGVHAQWDPRATKVAKVLRCGCCKWDKLKNAGLVKIKLGHW